MRFCVVAFVTSLVLIQSLYAAPIGENEGMSHQNENHLSNTFSTEAHAATCTSNNDLDDSVDEPILTRTRKLVDTQQFSESDSFQCHWENCNQVFNDATGLGEHVDKSHIVKGQKYYKCCWEACEYDCYKINYLTKHLRTHTGERPFVCRYFGCAKSFTVNCSLKRHIETIHSSKVQNIAPLEQECESLHLKNGKDQQRKVLHCDWKNCNSEFNDVTLLSNHIKKDHIGKGKSRYECQWRDCSYATASKYDIERHMRKHTKERPFICYYINCGKSFSTKGNLNRHIEDNHLCYSSFPCPLLQCDKKYSNVATIRNHLLIHATASNFSFSDVDAIWNAFHKKLPYPADISSRIPLKIEKNTQESIIATVDQLTNESKEKQMELNADNANTLTNVIEENISFIDSEREHNSLLLNNANELTDRFSKGHTSHGKSFYKDQWKDCTKGRLPMVAHVRTHNERPLDCGKALIQVGALNKHHQKIQSSKDLFRFAFPADISNKNNHVAESVSIGKKVSPLNSNLKRPLLSDNLQLIVSKRMKLSNNSMHHEKQTKLPHLTPLNETKLAPLRLTLGEFHTTLLFDGKIWSHEESDKNENVRINVLNDAYVFQFRIRFESVLFWNVKCDNGELKIYLKRKRVIEQNLYVGSSWNEMLLSAELKWGFCPNHINPLFNAFGQLQITLPRHSPISDL